MARRISGRRGEAGEFRVPSASGQAPHIVTVTVTLQNVRYACDCPGWVYRGYCTHQKDVRDALGRERVAPTEPTEPAILPFDLELLRDGGVQDDALVKLAQARGWVVFDVRETHPPEPEQNPPPAPVGTPFADDDDLVEMFASGKER